MNDDSSGSSLSAPSVEIIQTSTRQLRNKLAKSLQRAIFKERNQAAQAHSEQHLHSPDRKMMKS